MLYLYAQLLLMLLLIFFAAQCLTNALEHGGQKAGLSAGVTGSIFAAIATALPETSVPILALIADGDNFRVNEQVSIGAILGAPLMISTLSTAVMACFALKKRGWKGRVCPEILGFKRDINFFLGAFLLAMLALFFPIENLFCRALVSVILVSLYLVYLRQTFKASRKLTEAGYGVKADGPLILTKIGLKNSKITILVQLLLGLALLFWGAKGFIKSVTGVSLHWGVSALFLSLIIIPVATELPEKVNSIVWIRKGKDTLAFGNLTGALVFQGTLLPALGVLLQTWVPNRDILFGMGLTLLAAAWLRWQASKEGLALKALFVNGFLYLLYITFALSGFLS